MRRDRDPTFEELYEAHAGEVLAFFARRTFDAQTALDLTGETFARAFAGRGRFRGSGPEAAAGWLFGVARNVLREYGRRGLAERRMQKRLGVERVVLSDEAAERLEELAGTEVLRAAIADGLARLPRAQRDAIDLRVVHGLGYQEVAARLGVSEQAARARVSRGLRTLQAGLDGSS